MKATVAILSLLLVVFPALLLAQGVSVTKVDEALGRSGQKSGDVYRVGFPRTDLHVTVVGMEVKPGLALGSWAAFSGSDSQAMVMGDLVLLETELNPVIKALRAAGFEVTAVHNHLIGETPHVLYTHYMGHGEVSAIAKSLRQALEQSKTPLDKPAAAPAPGESPVFVATIEGVIGSKGRFAGGVLSFGIPRADPVTDHGVPLTGAPRRGRSNQFPGSRFGKSCDDGRFRSDG
ncbi:MAG TPA: DUF1259 domain-containing protein [Candidatus Sulfotelmatobacter sp.]